MKINQVIDKEKEKREKEKNFKKRVEELEKSVVVQEVMQKHEKQLRQVFAHFKEYTDFKIERNDKENMTFKGYV